MNTVDQRHLEPDQIIQAVVDEHDLDPETRRHLHSCPHCRTLKSELVTDLSHLGTTARTLAPSPRKAFRIPDDTKARKSRRFWAWSGVLGAAATAVLILAVFNLTMTMPSREPVFVNWGEEIWDTDPLMMEINMLTENALPTIYLELGAEFPSTVDPGFMEYLLPDLEADELSLS